MIDIASELIGQGIIADVNEKVDVISADGFTDDSLRFSGTEPGNVAGDNVGASLIALHSRRGLVVGLAVSSPLYKIIIYLVADHGTALQRDDSETSDRKRVIIIITAFCHV